MSRVEERTNAKIARGDAASKRRRAERRDKRKAKQDDRHDRLETRRQARRDRIDARSQRRNDRKQARIDRAEQRTARRTEKQVARAAKLDRARQRATRWAATAPDAASTVVYAVALASAMGGQVSTAVGVLPTLPTLVAVAIGAVIAVFIEGAAVAAATTTHRLRKAGGRPVLPALLTWVFAATAAAIQWYGHRDEPVLAVVLMVATLTAVTVHEMRTRATLAEEAIARTRAPIRWGWRRWLVDPGQTFAAWRTDVLSRTPPEGRAVLADADTRRAAARMDRLRRRAVRRGQGLVHVSIVVTDTDTCTRADCPAPLGCTGGHPDRDADPDASTSGWFVPADWALTDTPDTVGGDVSAFLSAPGAVALADRPDEPGDVPAGHNREDTGADTPATKRPAAAARTVRRIDHDTMVSARKRLRAEGQQVSARKMAAATGYGHSACGRWLKDNPEDTA